VRKAGLKKRHEGIIGLLEAQNAQKDVFQSAPRSFDRGDLRPHAKAAKAAKFQSAPWSFDRGD